MNNIWTIIKKELARFFGDRRLVFTTVLMPGLLIYFMYTLMGEGLMKELTTEDDYVAQAYVVNMPAQMSPILESEDFPVDWEVWDGVTDKEARLKEIEEGEKDGVLYFSSDFMEKMTAYEVGQGAAPNVEIYYNSAESNSGMFYSVVKEFLGSFEESLVNKFDINAGEGSLGSYDQADEKSFLGQMMAAMLPMLIMTFIYSGCTAVAPESIAGEKERGTIATLLVTPMKRSALALGKIISLSIVALLAGISSFAGTILSLPKMMGGEVDFQAASYAIGDYLQLLIVIISTVLVMVAIISMISAGSKSVKEATTAMAPFMIIIMLASLLPMFGLKDVGRVAYLIPLFNSVMTMNGIFGFEGDLVNMVITTVVNLITAGVLAMVLTRMFSSEKVMFNK